MMFKIFSEYETNVGENPNGRGFLKMTSNTSVHRKAFSDMACLSKIEGKNSVEKWRGKMDKI
jgi:hypothetical protein